MKVLLEKAFNRYLALDPESEQRIAALQGKIVTLELIGLSLTVQLVFTHHNVQMHWDHCSEADLTIRGTPLNLLHMSLAKEQRKKFFAEDVKIEGNMELAQQILAVFDELEIDWEDQFARIAGDIPAYHTGQVFKKIKRFNQRLCNAFSYNLNEYIHEEINLFPPIEALQHFFHDVDDLRMDVDRLEVRIEQLQKKIRDSL